MSKIIVLRQPEIIPLKKRITMKKIILSLLAILFISIAQAQVNPPSVKIGRQTWMVKNLDVSTYRNGDPIPEVKDSAEWSKLTTGAWCYYNNDPANGKIYGKLYNWYAVNDVRGFAPIGWHVPIEAEWIKLATYLGGEFIAGGKLKSTSSWSGWNTGATNESGFTCLPGGGNFNGKFDNIGIDACLWSSTIYTIDNAYARYILLQNYGEAIFILNNNKTNGFSVRCIKD